MVMFWLVIAGLLGWWAFGLDPADHDPVARVVAERVAGDGDVAGAEAGAAGGGVRVLADAQADLAQVGERVAAEGDAGGRGDLDGGGHLVPVVAGWPRTAGSPTEGQQPKDGCDQVPVMNAPFCWSA